MKAHIKQKLANAINRKDGVQPILVEVAVLSTTLNRVGVIDEIGLGEGGLVGISVFELTVTLLIGLSTAE